MRRSTRILAVAWFVILLAVPALATLFTDRATIGNRAVNEYPSLTAGDVWDGDYFVGVDRYLEDRLSVRERAIELNAEIAYEVFGDSASESVLIGKDDVLFLAGTYVEPCRAAREGRWPVGGDVRASLDQFGESLEGRGAALYYTIVPEKAWVHPDYLPGALPDAPCSRPLVDDVRAAVAGDDRYLDLFAFLVNRAETENELLYQRTDTHWNNFGRSVAVEFLVDQLAAGTFDRSDLVAGAARSGPGGDLARLLGYDVGDSDTPITVDRPDVTMVAVDRDRPGREWHSQGSGSLVPGRTFILTDSHLNTSAGALAPWFEDVVIVRFQDLADANAADIAEADRVVLAFSARFSAERLRSLSRRLDQMLPE